MSLAPTVWRGSPWNSQQGVNGQGPWRGGLWRSERDSTAIAIRRLLFAQGQQGAMYVPRPIVLGNQALFQDSAGTTPVTADGEPVGLMLDLHKGLVRGAESVSNGTFDTDLAGWAGGDWSWDAGTAFLASSSTTSSYLAQNDVGTIGKTYEITLDIVSADGAVEIRLGGSAPAESVYQFTTPGVKTAILPWNGTNSTVYLRRTATGASARIDNISVRELPGNHATQATAAAKPIYRTDGVRHWLEGDGVDDRLAHTVALTDASTLVVSAERLAGGGTDVQGIFTVTPAGAELKSNMVIKAPDSENWGTYANAWKGSSVSLLDNPAVISLTASGGPRATNVQTLYTNGAQSAQATGGYAGDANPRMFILSETPARPAVARFFGAVAVDTVLADDARRQVEQHVAKQAGVTL